MAFMLSPGVQVVEKDFTSIVPAVSTSNGAFAGVFRWGPVLDPTLIASENELVQKFGGPNNGTAISFFSAANFLAYANSLLTVRVDTTGQKNAVATLTGGVDETTVSEGGSGYVTAPTVTFDAPDIEGGTRATGTAVIESGAVTEILLTEAGSGYSTAPSVTFEAADGDPGIGAVASCTIATAGIKINNESVYEDNYINGAGVVGEFAAKYPGTLGNSLLVSMADDATYSTWDFADEFDAAPDAGELHIIVIDEDGLITGVEGTILEKYAFLSKAGDARKSDGSNNYYKFVINNNSKYVWWMDHPAETTNWGSDELGTTFDQLAAALEWSLAGGTDDFEYDEGDLQTGFELFTNAELYDISLIVTGKCQPVTANYVIQNVAEVRKDCIAFISAQNADTNEIIKGSATDLAADIVAYRNELTSSSYATLDSGYKYQYDRYNDVYRWIPLNGDVAGLCARTDNTNDPWWSPGGYTRGQIKNVVKLAYNPNQTARDTLYKNGVNPVCAFPGQGTILYGDKTLLAKPSAFDRINVRRLFIVLEKAIAIAAKYQLFEFNDSFTRAQFKSMVEPFLRDVQGRRGLYDFRVVCDETNNTGEVIDSNRFVADIFLKPARSINFITLNFVAVRTSVSFDEVGG